MRASDDSTVNRSEGAAGTPPAIAVFVRIGPLVRPSAGGVLDTPLNNVPSALFGERSSTVAPIPVSKL